jgi:extradiol dioxygenase family protein
VYDKVPPHNGPVGGLPADKDVQTDASTTPCNTLLPCLQFHELARRVQDSGITFIIEPHLRFEGVHYDQFSICTS